MENILLSQISRLTTDLDLVASVSRTYTTGENRVAAQLLALSNFVNAFGILKAIQKRGFRGSPSTGTLTKRYPNARVQISYRLEEALVKGLAELGTFTPLESDEDCLEDLAKVWGHEECNYLRTNDEVMFSILEAELGVLVQAHYLLEEETEDEEEGYNPPFIRKLLMSWPKPVS